MPGVRNMDGSSGYADAQRWLPPPSLPVCEPAQILDRGADCPWPFLYSYRGNTVIINKAQRTSKYQEALAVGEAQF